MQHIEVISPAIDVKRNLKRLEFKSENLRSIGICKFSNVVFAFPDKSRKCFYLTSVPFHKNIILIHIQLNNISWACHPILEYYKKEKINLLWSETKTFHTHALWRCILHPTKKTTSIVSIKKNLNDIKTKNKNPFQILDIGDIGSILQMAGGKDCDIDFDDYYELRFDSPNRIEIKIEDEKGLIKNDNKSIKIFANFIPEVPIAIMKYLKKNERIIRVLSKVKDEPGAFYQVTKLLEKYTTILAINIRHLAYNPKDNKNLKIEGILDFYLILKEGQFLHRIINESEASKNGTSFNIIRTYPVLWVPELIDELIEIVEERLGISWGEVKIEESSIQPDEYRVYLILNNSIGKKLPTVRHSILIITIKGSIRRSNIKYFVYEWEKQKGRQKTCNEVEKLYTALLFKDNIILKTALKHVKG